jgi:hypothetical protein
MFKGKYVRSQTQPIAKHVKNVFNCLENHVEPRVHRPATGYFRSTSLVG